MLKLKSISPSRIKTFDMCKFKYWLTYHRPDLELKSNWGAAHGSLIHDLLENKANGNDVDWLNRLYRGYAGTLETLDRYGKPTVMESPLRWAKPRDYHEQIPDCLTCEEIDQENNRCGISHEPLDSLNGCAKMLFDGSVLMMKDVIKRYQDTWDRILRDPSGQLVGTEYGYNLPIEGTNVPMIGIMDLVVEEDPETVHIIDYKSGSWTQNYDECRDDIQVRMYSLASRKEFVEDVHGKGYNYKNVLLTFDYFTKQPVTVAFSAEEDAETENFVYKKIQEIQNTDWITRIVSSNDDFSQRWAWKCKYICDHNVCGTEWNGAFSTDGQN
jgi:hypothetical protein